MSGAVVISERVEKAPFRRAVFLKSDAPQQPGQQGERDAQNDECHDRHPNHQRRMRDHHDSLMLRAIISSPEPFSPCRIQPAG